MRLAWGWIHGTRYGIALDSLPFQYGSSEVEAAVVQAYEGERPEVIVIEGLGPLSHPAYLKNQLWAEYSALLRAMTRHSWPKPCWPVRCSVAEI